MIIGSEPHLGHCLMSRRRLILFLPHFGQEAPDSGWRPTKPVIPQGPPAYRFREEILSTRVIPSRM